MPAEKSELRRAVIWSDKKPSLSKDQHKKCTPVAWSQVLLFSRSAHTQCAQTTRPVFFLSLEQQSAIEYSSSSSRRHFADFARLSWYVHCANKKILTPTTLRVPLMTVGLGRKKAFFNSVHVKVCIRRADAAASRLRTASRSRPAPLSEE
jgi:hypothetical protein